MLDDARRSAMAARLRQGRSSAVAGITRRPPGAEVPLSFGQEQLWFLDQIAPGLATYNIAGCFRLLGPLDVAALGRALDALVARHEALRTRLVAVGDGHPVQVVDDPAPVPLPVRELTEADERDFVLDRSTRPFDLANGPLFRADLGRRGPDEHLVLLCAHHTVFDGWSMGVMVRDLAAFYGQESGGPPAKLPELPVQFGDYAAWERERLQGESLQRLADWWRNHLAGVSTLQLPTDRPRALLEDFKGAVVRRPFEGGLVDRLQEVARQEGTTLFVVLMAAFDALLHRYTGQDDVVVGTPTANRTRPELAGMIGYLVNTLPVRADMSGDPTFSELVRRLRDTTVEAYTHQELPFAKMVEVLQVQRDPSRAPLTQILFLHATDTAGAAPVAGGVEFRLVHHYTDPGTAKLDLTFAVTTVPGDTHVLAQYATALFDRTTMERLLGHYTVLLEGAAQDPSQRLSELPLLTEEELFRELVEWNDTERGFDIDCFHRRFEQQVERTPEAVAAELDDDRLTYAELNADANRIARRLHDLGVGPEVMVGISMAPAPRRLAALLGILKAGGAYVPLDPDLPHDRLAYMVGNARISVVVCDETGETGIPDAGVTLLPLHRERDELARLDASNPGYPVGTGNAAYVIYTSGSTGAPKGVVVEHGQAMHVLLGLIDRFGVGPGDRVLQFASLNFDVSVADIFMTLLSGATVVIGSKETLHTPPRLAELIRRGVTVAGMPPAVLSLLPVEDFPSLRLLMPAGEELPSELARAWVRPGLRLCNAYGPTEACIYATIAEIDGSVMPPPIGLPVPDYQCYVLDPALNPVPVGVVGELHIGGAGVARGYLGQPALTEQRFVPDPFRDEPGARLYKTGDLVRRLPDGQIQYLGRLDGQVKLHGLRIELGEIETALASHPSVAQAVVTVFEDRAGAKHLVAHVRLEDGPNGEAAALHPAELRRHLADWLPSYMVPNHFVAVDVFPLNDNGKIDKRALPMPDATEAAVTYAPPTSLLETLVVDTYVGVLRLDRVGIDDSFFDVGGNSLQAMRLIARLRDDLAIDLDVTALFLFPTPRQLAARIEGLIAEDDRAGTPRHLVELAGAPGRAPLFLVHAIGGTVHSYVPLAHALASTYHVYGIEAAGLDSPDAPASIEALAAWYVAAVREAQPEGPYRVAGWSMGGLVAYEMARQMEWDGDEVAELVLLDAPFAIPQEPALAPEQVAAEFVADAARTAGLGVDDLPDPTSASVSSLVQWLAERLAGSPADTAELRGELERRLAVFGVLRRMLSGHRPQGSLKAETLVIGAVRSPNAAHQPHWHEVLAGEVGEASLDCDHYTLLQHPHVRDVAEVVVPALGLGR
jgi:amino acid adenylation domain-containing protein